MLEMGELSHTFWSRKREQRRVHKRQGECWRRPESSLRKETSVVSVKRCQGTGVSDFFLAVLQRDIPSLVSLAQSHRTPASVSVARQSNSRTAVRVCARASESGKYSQLSAADKGSSKTHNGDTGARSTSTPSGVRGADRRAGDAAAERTSQIENSRAREKRADPDSGDDAPRALGGAMGDTKGITQPFTLKGGRARLQRVNAQGARTFMLARFGESILEAMTWAA